MRALILVLLLAGCPSIEDEPPADPTPTPLPKRALLVGIDGLRGDVLDVAETPTFDALRDGGAWTLTASTQSRAPTVSGPGWTSILTGVDADKHNIYANSGYEGRNPVYPSFLWRAREAGLSTCAAIHWLPIQAFILEDDALDEHAIGTDEQVTDEMVRMIGEGTCEVAFVHLDDVDGAGHSTGFSPDNPAYVDAVEVKDAEVGRLLEAVQARDEDWLVIVTSDHGGIGTGHGGVTDEEKQVPFLVAGPSAAPGQLIDATHMDGHPTALQHVGVPPQADWDLDGAVVGLR